MYMSPPPMIGMGMPPPIHPSMILPSQMGHPAMPKPQIPSYMGLNHPIGGFSSPSYPPPPLLPPPPQGLQPSGSE